MAHIRNLLMQHSIGFVYVLTNPAMPGLVKIGLTSWLPEDRAKHLDTTSIPEPFDVAYRTATSRPEAVERKAHKLLGGNRKRSNREFFRVSVEEAVEAVRTATVDVAGIESWKSSERHFLDAGDRLALTLEGGQIFALVSFRNEAQVLAGRLQPLDLWQAHSDGDLLEIFGTESPSDVAGLSDNDPGSTDDPVPYLNREATAPNGNINGRERLVPGDRLVWLPTEEKAEWQASVTFEARAYCQVVSRTWSPKLGPIGMPLILNDFTYNTAWPAALDSIRAAMAPPLPRCWAPRSYRDPSQDQIDYAPLAPEHWLPQLKPRARKQKRKK